MEYISPTQQVFSRRVFFDSRRGNDKKFYLQSYICRSFFEEYDPTPEERNAAEFECTDIRWTQRVFFDMHAPTREQVQQLKEEMNREFYSVREIANIILRPDLEIDTATPQGWADQVRNYEVRPGAYCWGYLKNGHTGPVDVFRELGKYLMFHAGFFFPETGVE